LARREKPKPRAVRETAGPLAVTAMRKKTLRIDQQLLDRARRALGLRTETDTIMQALEAVVQRERQVQGLRALADLGPFDAKRIED
jgi:hypothetical protein